MVLDSQIGRPGAGRRHMVSRRRRSKKWPLALAAIAGLVVVAWLAWPGGEAEPVGADGGSDGGGEQVAQGAESRAAEPSDAARSQRNASPPNGSPTSAAAVPSPPRAAPPAQTAQTEQESAAQAEPDDAPEPEPVRTRTFDRPDVRVDPPQSPDVEAPAAADSNSTDAASADLASRARSAARSTGGELQRGMQLIAEGDYVQGRRTLSQLLYSGRISDAEAQTIRRTLAEVNERLIFSNRVFSNDPTTEAYTVQSGDVLVNIARRYKVTYQFIQRINGMSDANTLRVGQQLKLVEGPFHARIDKSDYRMDILLHDRDGTPLYIRSYSVGLGENNATPVGDWVVRPGHKVENPGWKNPRTGEYFEPDDPENPIGDYWLALEGVDENTSNQSGYGIHGTIEPDSIGRQASMGCIRLHDGDIEQVYYMLVGGESRVTITR